MSGSGGYYKYRCKYWLTYNCPNWVWVNNSPCANCLAEARDLIAISFGISREVYVPHFENGFLHYFSTEVVATSDVDIGWAINILPSQVFEKDVKASAMHGIAAMDIIDTQRVSKNGLKVPSNREAWNGSNANMEWAADARMGGGILHGWAYLTVKPYYTGPGWDLLPWSWA